MEKGQALDLPGPLVGRWITLEATPSFDAVGLPFAEDLVAKLGSQQLTYTFNRLRLLFHG